MTRGPPPTWRAPFNNWDGAGTFTMTGGNATLARVDVGTGHDVDTTHIDFGDGFYEQTGGSASVGLLNLRRGTEFSARSFQVASGASMTFTGNGTSWSIANWDTSGTLAFDPGSGVTSQSILAFGQEIGADAAGVRQPLLRRHAGPDRPRWQ